MGSWLGAGKNFLQEVCLGNEDSCNVGPQVQEPNTQSCTKGLKFHAECSKGIGDGPINVGPFFIK
jgi:hypothetical protein